MMKRQKLVDEGSALLARADAVWPPEIEFHISLALRHIEEKHSDSSMSLRSVSAACGLSRSHFSRLFKRCVGAGFRDYLRDVRLQEATKLLESSALSVKEIATLVGFQHTSDLDRHMKRSMGTTPSALRAGARARRAS